MKTFLRFFVVTGFLFFGLAANADSITIAKEPHRTPHPYYGLSPRDVCHSLRTLEKMNECFEKSKAAKGFQVKALPVCKNLLYDDAVIECMVTIANKGYRSDELAYCGQGATDSLVLQCLRTYGAY